MHRLMDADCSIVGGNSVAVIKVLHCRPNSSHPRLLPRPLNQNQYRPNLDRALLHRSGR